MHSKAIRPLLSYLVNSLFQRDKPMKKKISDKNFQTFFFDTNMPHYVT